MTGIIILFITACSIAMLHAYHIDRLRQRVRKLEQPQDCPEVMAAKLRASLQAYNERHFGN